MIAPRKGDAGDVRIKRMEAEFNPDWITYVPASDGEASFEVIVTVQVSAATHAAALQEVEYRLLRNT